MFGKDTSIEANAKHRLLCLRKNLRYTRMNERVFRRTLYALTVKPASDTSDVDCDWLNCLTKPDILNSVK